MTFTNYRNAAKREYATRYWAWLLTGQTTNEPDRGTLSYMGAQAVRMDLYARLLELTNA